MENVADSSQLGNEWSGGMHLLRKSSEARSTFMPISMDIEVQDAGSCIANICSHSVSGGFEIDLVAGLLLTWIKMVVPKRIIMSCVFLVVMLESNGLGRVMISSTEYDSRPG
jgi:hypothetical protein